MTIIQGSYVKSGLIDLIAEAIARTHKFHNHFSLAYRTNNPGLIAKLAIPMAYSATKSSHVISEEDPRTLYFFPEASLGWKALKKKVEHAIKKEWHLQKLLDYNYRDKKHKEELCIEILRSVPNITRQGILKHYII
jgi:hypothetical protein